MITRPEGVLLYGTESYKEGWSLEYAPQLYG